MSRYMQAELPLQAELFVGAFQAAARKLEQGSEEGRPLTIVAFIPDKESTTSMARVQGTVLYLLSSEHKPKHHHGNLV